MLLKKISAKTVVGNIKALVKSLANDTIVDLMTIYGRANGVKTGESNFGDWTAFTGSFEVINLQTGEQSQAPQVFVMEPLQSMLADMLRTNDTVDFAMKISCKVNDELPQGYEYIITPITEVQKSDELASLRELASSASQVNPVKALAAPVETTETEGDPAPEAAPAKKKK